MKTLVRGGIAFVLLAGLVAIAMHKLGLSSLTHSFKWVRFGAAGTDSWHPMGLAYQRLHDPTAAPLYDLFFVDGVKFQYPPTSLLPYALGTSLGVDISDTLLRRLDWGSVLITALSSLAFCLFYLRTTYPAAPRRAQAEGWLLAGGFAALTLLFFPVVRAYSLGQIQSWITAAFALACLAWFWHRRALAGTLIGAICLIKPQFGLFLLWGILRRQRAFVLGWVAVFSIGALISVYLFGLGEHFAYLDVLRFISQHGESYHSNQSVNGLMLRLMGIGNNLTWSPDSFPPFNPIVYAATLTSSALIILIALLWNAGPGDKASNLDFLTAALSFTLASPVAWKHHYGLLPMVFIALFFETCTRTKGWERRGLLGVLGACYLLSAGYFTPSERVAGTYLNVVESHVFFAAVAVLVMLYRIRAAGVPSAAPLGVQPDMPPSDPTRRE